MNLQVFLVCLITEPIDFLIYMDLVKLEFEKRNMFKLALIPVLVVTAIVSSFATAALNQNMNLFAHMFMTFLMLAILFKGKLVKKIIYVVVIVFISALAEMIFALSYSAYSGVSVQELSTNIYAWTLLLFGTEIIKLILVKIWKRCFGRNKKDSGGKIFMVLLLFPVVTVVTVYELISLSPYMSLLEYRKVCVLNILLLFADAVLFYYVERMMVMMKQQKEYALLRQKNEMENRYYKRMEEINHEQSLYRHDMKHYLEVISGLAEEKNVEGLRKISGQLYEELNKVERIRYTGNEILNVVLWEKKNQAAELEIQLNMEVEPGIDTSFIKDTDLIAMAGNLIDNAIEAVKECSKDKSIDISLFETEGNFIIFQVTNHFMDKPIMKNGVLLTKKKDTENHGMGVESVRKIAEKYGGILDVDIEEDTFKATLGIATNYAK